MRRKMRVLSLLLALIIVLNLLPAFAADGDSFSEEEETIAAETPETEEVGPSQESPVVKIALCNLSLEGDIAVKFFLLIPEEVVNSGVYIMINDVRHNISEYKPEIANGLTGYQFKHYVTAKQMNDDIVLRPYNSDGTLLTFQNYKTGQDYTSTGYHYSVQTYIQKQYKESSDEKLVALLESMSDYGSKAQAYFKYDIDSAKEICNADGITNVSLDDLADYEKSVMSLECSLIYKGSSLILQAMTTLRVGFALTEGEISDYRFSLMETK